MVELEKQVVMKLLAIAANRTPSSWPPMPSTDDHSMMIIKQPSLSTCEGVIGLRKLRRSKAKLAKKPYGFVSALSQEFTFLTTSTLLTAMTANVNHG
jgi:hypothetical protein